MNASRTGCEGRGTGPEGPGQEGWGVAAVGDRDA